MTLDETMKELASLGSESTRKTWLRHGAPEPIFGVKIGDMKGIFRRIKGDQELAMKLYATGNGDAMYLAGMVADGRRMSRAELDRWARAATWSMIAGTTVPWVASEHPEGFRIAAEWTESPEPHVAIAGWSTLSALAATVPDDCLSLREFGALLARLPETIAAAPDRVRYAMNGFVIAVGTYVAPLADDAVATARRIGRVECDMGETACRVPDAESYIAKARRGMPVAPKRRTVRC